MSDTLKPCPFCGHAPDTATGDTGTSIYCSTESCGGACTRIGSDETDRHAEEAVATWNRRVPPQLSGITEETSSDGLVTELCALHGELLAMKGEPHIHVVDDARLWDWCNTILRAATSIDRAERKP